MARQLILFCTLMLCFPLAGICQLVCARLAQPIFPKGDTSRAIHSRHHNYTGSVVVAQLGYIDTNYATIQEIADNMEVGVLALPVGYYTVVEFGIAVEPKGCDLKGPYKVAGNKLLAKADTQIRSLLATMRAGDILFITDIRARSNGSTQTFPIKKEIKIKITGE